MMMPMKITVLCRSRRATRDLSSFLVIGHQKENCSLTLPDKAS
jgi:hypothetical protein